MSTQPERGPSSTPEHLLRVPVQDSSEWDKPNGSIAWWEHVEAWEMGYGYDQTALRIAQRGGFSYAEIVYSLGHEPTTWEPGRIGWQYTPMPDVPERTVNQNREARAFYKANAARLRPSKKGSPSDEGHLWLCPAQSGDPCGCGWDDAQATKGSDHA